MKKPLYLSILFSTIAIVSGTWVNADTGNPADHNGATPEGSQVITWPVDIQNDNLLRPLAYFDSLILVCTGERDSSFRSWVLKRDIDFSDTAQPVVHQYDEVFQLASSQSKSLVEEECNQIRPVMFARIKQLIASSNGLTFQ